MQIEFKLKRILPILFGLAFLWIVFLLSKFLLLRPENLNRNYIPAHSSMVMRIDGRHFLESATYDLIYKNGDESVLQQLENLSSRSRTEGKLRDAGINFLSDVIVFTQSFEGKSIVGFIFNLSDEDKFKQAMFDIVQKNQAFATNGEIGIFISDPSRSIRDKKLSAHAGKLLIGSTKPSYLKRWNSNDGTFLDVEIKDHPETGIQSASLQAKLNASLLEVKGELMSAEKKSFSSKSLKPDGFHFSIAVINQQMQDQLKEMMSQEGFNFPDLARISINYRGISLDNGTNPMADLLLEFESAVDLKQLSENTKGFQKLGFKIPPVIQNGQTVELGNLGYVLTVVDEKTIFIGQNYKNVQDLKSDHLLLLEGDPTKITYIEGGGLFGMTINLYPPYRAGKEFISSIETADLKIIPQQGKHILDGKIRFKKNKYPVSETLKLIAGLDN